MAAAGSSGPSVTAGREGLGLADADLEDLKTQAAVILQPGRAAKRPKLSHNLFFEDERGLKKVMKSFSKIRFQGRGKEFEDMEVLLRNYEMWSKNLYPFEDNFEDFVWKARAVLQEKELSENGRFVSDPKELLHQLRADYKLSGIGGTKAHANLAASEATAQKQLSEEVRRRIEENRKRALEIRKRREEASAAFGQAPAAAPAPPRVPDEEEDVFGFGGGFDDDFGPSGPSTASKRNTMVVEEEDVFGFGGGLDDDGDFGPLPAAPPPVPPPADVPVAPKQSVNPEVAKRVAENRAKALEIKRKREADAALLANDMTSQRPPAAEPMAPAMVQPLEPASTKLLPTVAPTVNEDFFAAMDDDEDVFGFGGGMDE